MKKKILLSTDFSKNAWNAIVYALELYKNEACDFYVLNAFNASGFLKDGLMAPEPGEASYEKAKAESEDGLVKIMRMITFREENNSKHTFETISAYNVVLDAIKQIVEDKDIELVVMGTKGASNTKGLLFGSNAIDAMEKVRNSPVLVVPEITDSIPPKEIVFPTSYKTHFKRRELNYLVETAQISSAAIRILHVSEEDDLNENQQDHRAMLEEYFEGLEYSFHSLHNIKVPTAVSCFVESRSSDMVAFINKKHAFFGSLISNPLVKDIGHHTKVPVLVMHDLRN